MLRSAVFAIFLARAAFAQCEPAGKIKEVLDADSAVNRSKVSDGEKKAQRAEILDAALASSPTDYFLLDRQRGFLDDGSAAAKESLLARYAALSEKYHDSPAVATVYADVLKLKDSAQALALLEASKKAHPGFPFNHLKLISIFEFGKFQNKARLSEEIESFLKACPDTSGAYVYRVLLSQGSADQIARHAAALRARLEAESGAPNQGLWTVLWDLDFKAVPPTGHAAVRERLAKDLANFDESSDRNKLSFLSFLRLGYSKTDNKEAVNRIDDQILKDYPTSEEAERLITEQWRKEHPFPAGKDPAEQQAFHRASAAAAREWHEKWPNNNMWRRQEFTAMAALGDTKPADLLKLAEEYMADYHRHGNWYGATPMEFDVADALIQKKILPGAIPEWIENGYSREANRPSRALGQFRDNLTDEMKANADRQVDHMRIERARVLLDYYDAIRQPAKSRAIDDQLSGLMVQDQLKPRFYEVRAKAAEMDNRKLDALLFYRAARDVGSSGPKVDASRVQSLNEKIDRLYKDLGGTPASLSLFTGKTRLEPVSAIRWEKPKNQLPAFSLSDLQGKTWKLADLNGKATLINVWTTWCPPCRAEHLEFQKLYEKLKDRKDIALLSLNVDDSVGLVAPYMAENHYTFPVILGKDLMEATGVENAVPQNWFLTPAAKLEATQLGYAPGPQWENTMIEKLEELLKAK